MGETSAMQNSIVTPKLQRAWARLTTRPETSAEQLLNGSVIWLALMAYWAFADVLLVILPPARKRYGLPRLWHALPATHEVSVNLICAVWE